MLVVVDGVNEIVRAGVNAVGAAVELAFAEGTHEVAVFVQDDDRVLAAIEDIDVVTRIDGHARDYDERPAVVQLGKILERFVLKVAVFH